VALLQFRDEFCGKYFPSAKTNRAKDNIAVKYRLPVIRIGNSLLIDEDEGIEQIKTFARTWSGKSRRLRHKPALLKEAQELGSD
jgi:hypothetical protein